jgi:hypothetical protein
MNCSPYHEEQNVFFIGVSSFNSYRDIEDNSNLNFSRKRVFSYYKNGRTEKTERIWIFKKIFSKYENMYMKLVEPSPWMTSHGMTNMTILSGSGAFADISTDVY